MSKLNFGIKWGLRFGVLGIPLSLIITIIVSLILESLANKLSYNIWDFSFYVSFFCLMVSLFCYLLAIIIKRKEKPALILLFVVKIIFLNVCLFYYRYAYRTDGQLAFALLELPLKTAIIYPLLGVFHEWIQGRLKMDKI